MDRLQRASSVLVGIASVSVAVEAMGTPHFDLCDTVSNEYRSLVEQRMREALSTQIEPLAIRFALPIQNETGIGITRDEDGFHLVRLAFDRSLWYESWIDVEDVPEDVDLSAVDGVSEVIYREDGGPLGYEIQDFSRVEPRISILSIPISEDLANELVEVLDSFDPANQDERSDLIILDGISINLFQTSGRCLTIKPLTGASAATNVVQLVRYLESEMGMGAWRAFRKEAFEAEILSMIRGIYASQ
jgi:hypothetical protein